MQNSRRNLISIGTYLAGDVLRGQYGSATILNQLNGMMSFLPELSIKLQDGIEYRVDTTPQAELVLFEVHRQNDNEIPSLNLQRVTIVSFTSQKGMDILRKLRAQFEELFDSIYEVAALMEKDAVVKRNMMINLAMTDGAPIQHLQFLAGTYLLTGGRKFVREVTAMYVLGRLELRTLFHALDVAEIFGTNSPVISPISMTSDTLSVSRLGQKNSYQLKSWKRGPVKISTYGTYRLRPEVVETDATQFTPADVLSSLSLNEPSPSVYVRKVATESPQHQIIQKPLTNGKLTEPIDRLLACEKILVIAAKAHVYKPNVNDMTDMTPLTDLAFELYTGGMVEIFASAVKLNMVIPTGYRIKFNAISKVVKLGNATEEDVTNILIAMGLILTQAVPTRADDIPEMTNGESYVPEFAEIHQAWMNKLKEM